MWRRSASFVLDNRQERLLPPNPFNELMEPQPAIPNPNPNPNPNQANGISAYYQTRAEHHAVVTSDWLAQAQAAVVGDAPPPARSSCGARSPGGAGKPFSVIDEFNYWRKKPDLAEAVAAIMALASLIRYSEASTMMELEIELKNASDSLKGKAERIIKG